MPSRVVMMGERRAGTLALAEVAGQGLGMAAALEGMRRVVDRWPVLGMGHTPRDQPTNIQFTSGTTGSPKVGTALTPNLGLNLPIRVDRQKNRK